MITVHLNATWRRSLRLPVLIALYAMLAGCAWMRPDLAVRVATGTTAHDLCSEVFVGGQDPGRVFAESLAPRPGYRHLAGAMRWELDRERGEVRASLGGLFGARAVFHDGWGCALEHAAAAGPARPPPDARAAPTAPAAAAAPAAVPASPAPPPSPALQALLDEAFAENDPSGPRHTKAVLVSRHGRLLAERYAPEVGPQTPLLGFSLSKSVVNALAGTMVHQGLLRTDASVPVDAAPGQVSLEQLMRMTSGLALDETGSGFDPSNHMLYLQDDMAGYAARAERMAPAGTRWFYSSASVTLVARALQQAAGGDAPKLRRYAQQQLFAPLGIERMVFETDAAGTPVGAHYMLAPARDWLRLGQLFLDDGVVGGRRLLPEGWVRWSTTPTLDTDYGAGWWVNRRDRERPAGQPAVDMPLMRDVPGDAFYALGNLGQYIVVVPSAGLVVVRLGRSHSTDFDLEGINRLVGGLLRTLR